MGSCNSRDCHPACLFLSLGDRQMSPGTTPLRVSGPESIQHLGVRNFETSIFLPWMALSAALGGISGSQGKRPFCWGRWQHPDIPISAGSRTGTWVCTWYTYTAHLQKLGQSTRASPAGSPLPPGISPLDCQSPESRMFIPTPLLAGNSSCFLRCGSGKGVSPGCWVFLFQLSTLNCSAQHGNFYLLLALPILS